MSIITGKKTKISLKEIQDITNAAYDRGGAAALNIILDVVETIEEKNPELSPHVCFTQHVVEGVRESLANAVSKIESKIQIVEG